MEKDPSRNNRTAYNQSTAKVRFFTKKAKQAKWINTCQTLDLRKDSHKAWNLMKNLSGNRKRTNPQPMPKKMAAKLPAV